MRNLIARKMWLKKRNAAVKSLDVRKFKKYCEKLQKRGCYKQPLPSDDVIEIAMYKMALVITVIPKDVKAKAAKWLLSHGYDLEVK